MTGHPDDDEIARALGQELWRVRDLRRLTRKDLAGMLPSRVGERSVTAYEHGTRHMTVVRLLEICRTAGVDAPSLLASALQRARVALEDLTLHVDVHALLREPTPMLFRPVRGWARNAVGENPVGVVQVEPAAVKHLALFVGCTHLELAEFLAGFTPAPGE